MNPITKEHKLLKVLQSKLPKGLSDYQINYAKRHCFDDAATESRNTMMCTECGHTWKVKNGKDITEAVCPHCGKKLTYVKHNSLRYKEIEYFCTSSAIQGYQMIRYWQFRKHVKPNDVSFDFDEVGTVWFNKNGHNTTFCLPRCMMPRYVDQWNFNGEIKLRRTTYFDRCPVGAVLTHSIIPTLKQHGWNGKQLHYNLFDTVHNLLTDSFYEQCYKSGQFGVCRTISSSWWRNPKNSEKQMRIFKICNRHGIKFAEPDDWNDMLDYVSDLEFFKKDIYNAQYITRSDWKEEHLRLSAKRNEIEAAEKERAERERTEKRALANENKRKWAIEYAPRFMSMNLTQGALSIKPLILWEDFCAEYEAMGHCIKTYFGKAETLLISISRNGVKAETAEINLHDNKLMQCRGKNNHPSSWHKEIVKFIEASMQTFQKRYKKEMAFNTLPAVIQKPIYKIA